MATKKKGKPRIRPAALIPGVRRATPATVAPSRPATTTPNTDVNSFVASNPQIRVGKTKLALLAVSSRALTAALRELKKKKTPAPDPDTETAARTLAAVLSHTDVDADRVRRIHRPAGWFVRIDLIAREALDLANLIQAHRRLLARHDTLLAKLARLEERKRSS